MKKWIALILSVAMTTSVTPTVFAAEDYVTRGEAVELLLEAADFYNSDVQETDIIKGYTDGTLQKDTLVTKTEALVMIDRAFGEFPELTGHNLRVALPTEPTATPPEWSEQSINNVFATGTVSIKPSDEFITQQEFLLMIERLYDLYGSNLKDSYYATINKDILNTLEIPTGQGSMGTVEQLGLQTQSQILDLIKNAINSTPEPGSPEEKIKILYENITNMEARNQAGYTPIKEDLENIAAANSLSELEELSILKGFGNALGIFVDFSLTIDNMDSTSYIPVLTYATASGLEQIYSGEAEAQKEAYLTYLETLLKLCGETPEQAKANAQSYFELEKRLSEASLTTEELNDINNTYNLYTLDELQEIFPMLNIKQIYANTGMKEYEHVVVSDVGNMKEVAKILQEESLDTIKNYIKIAVINYFARFSGEDFLNAISAYNQAIAGLSGMPSIEQQATSTISNVLSDYIGELYAEKYCSEKLVTDVTKMINDIKNVYRQRIQSLDWMSETTKQKALLKLDTMIVNVGAPNYEEEQSCLDDATLRSVSEGGSYFENMLEISKANNEEQIKSSFESVDHTEWITTPQTVNAFYMPSFNSINFPVAFLQSPIYDVNASYEENLGGLGTVIAHEMTHAFDSNGALFDENGNVANWWTPEDKAAFDKLCQDVIVFFDGQEAAPEITNNGTLTLSENVADLGAMACIVELGKQIPDFDYKALFEQYALLWANTSYREYLQVLLYMDVHASGNVRTDRVLQSIDKFYEVYDIKEGDGMYVAPENRVQIW